MSVRFVEREQVDTSRERLAERDYSVVVVESRIYPPDPTLTSGPVAVGGRQPSLSSKLFCRLYPLYSAAIPTRICIGRFGSR